MKRQQTALKLQGKARRNTVNGGAFGRVRRAVPTTLYGKSNGHKEVKSE